MLVHGIQTKHIFNAHFNFYISFFLQLSIQMWLKSENTKCDVQFAIFYSKIFPVTSKVVLATKDGTWSNVTGFILIYDGLV